MGRTSWLFLLVVATLGASVVAETSPDDRHPDAVTLPLVDGEFVWARIGYPGVAIAFWVRWDLDELAILYQVDIRSASRSWREDDHTDVVCFGAHCSRLPFATVDFFAPNQLPASRLAEPARGYTGILGLGRRSPVWRVFPFFRYSARELTLMRRRVDPPEQDRHHGAVYPAGVVPLRLAGVDLLARVDLATDYTLLPWELADAADTAVHWRLDVYQPDGRTRVSRAKMPVWQYRLADAHVHMIRGSAAALELTAHELASVTAPPQTVAVLGRALVQSAFVVQANVATGEMWLALAWSDAPVLDSMNYLTWFLVLLPLDVLWVFGVLDSVDYAQRTSVFDELLDENPTSSQRHVLRRANGSAWYVSAPRRLTPEGYSAGRWPTSGVRPLTLLSFRHRRFSAVFVLLTQAAFVTVVLLVVLGYGWLAQYWHDRFSTEDRFAMWSVVAVGGMLAASLWSLDVFPSTAAYHGDAVVLLTVWMLAAVNPFAVANSYVMLITSGTVAVYAVQLFAEAVLQRLWPWRGVYSARWLLWVAVLALLAAWAVWLFSFYTVVLVTLAWRNDYPGVWALAALSAVLVCFVVHRNLVARTALRIMLINAAQLFVANYTQQRVSRAAATASVKAR